MLPQSYEILKTLAIINYPTYMIKLFEEESKFIAMEYYGLILNRTFLICFTENSLIGFKIANLITLETKYDFLINPFIKVVQSNSDFDSINTYIENKYKKHIPIDNMNKNKASFIIEYSKIKSVKFNENKKFGMGYIPHQGRIIISYDKNREFIILGNQNSKKILQKLNEKINYK